jgi:predicted kinase
VKYLYLMCGLPYAGKTTLARAIAARAGAAIVSLDDITAERGLHGADDLPVEEWQRSHETALERAAALMAEGRAVVVDDTHGYRWLREDHRRQAAAHGYATQVVLLDVPFADCLDRARAAERGRDLPFEMLFRLAQEFEAPTLDEKALVYDGSQPPGAWAEENLPAE